ncbi:MAG: alpha/beta hydrolase [Rhodovulum sulfidophilum]|uniref:Alpha/beta hydrolase n=1 Tax=Rhodovulum sulfidophilum TaxID=35806 RepID=A0A2W5N7R6_RHOSU|nr:MAG: alpha/beta hydrolase [Rhodovulum sulfidophilum]
MIIDTPEGALACRAAGPADAPGPTLVLVHGIQGTAAVWTGVLTGLATGRRVLAPHLRGRAGSFAPADPAAYTMAAFARDLGAVLARAPRQVVLVGWSMGCLVALEHLRAQGADGLAGLVLVSGSACLATPPAAVWFRGDTPEAIAANAEARARRLGLAETATGMAVAGSWISARSQDYRPALRALALPTLVLHGTEDPECPVAHGEALAAGIPGARLSLWEGHGHVPMAAAPERFAAELDGFVRSRATIGA